MFFHEALRVALDEGVKTLQRKGDMSSLVVLHPMGFFRDSSNQSKVFLVAELLADDWEAA